MFFVVAPRAQQPPQAPRPTFETKAELVLVDVNVVDRDARPVPTLTAADFDVQVNGQPRPITSIQFISTEPTNTTPSTPRETAYSSNESSTTGRLLLFVTDESNLRVGSGRAVLRTAQTLFDRLAPGDLVGLSRLPTGAGSVEFTADRKRITDALLKVTGTLNSRIGMSRVRIGEAYALETNDSATWQGAIDRECAGESGASVDACATAVEGDARALLIEASSRSNQTIGSLERLLKSLAELSTPVNIVMVSEGMFIGRDRNDMTGIARLAAEARATIHVIRPGQTFFEVDDPGIANMSRFLDDSLLSEGLEMLAGQTRGTMATVNGSATIAFDRLGRELSGYYLLGFEPTDADRTGRERRIRVQVKPRGLSVRARPTFVIRETAGSATAASGSAVSPVQHLTDVLRAPLPTRGLPIRVASYTAIDNTSSKIRVVITAEAGDPATEEAEWPVGMIILDKNDKAVMSRAGNSKLAPASVRGESPRLILTSLLLDPGEYTLRVAAVDDKGRAGSAHHTINARLTKVGNALNASDLMLVSQPANAGDLPRPRPSSVIDSETLSAMMEISGTDQALLNRARVTFQIADAEDGTPLVSVEAKSASRGNSVRAYAAALRLGVLPPGEYVARALINVPGNPEARLARPFLMAPVAAPTTEPLDLDVPLDPDAPPAPLAESRILAPVPRFRPQSILVPEVVTPFLDGLSSLHPPSPEVEEVVEKARSGQFTPPQEPASSPDDELNLAFVRGLDALNKNQVPQAAAYFQQTLKGAADFLGAAFYLGATHAASGRDKEAVGAWQMALLSENPAAVYPVLVDALLRLGDGRQAIDLLEEAPTAWANDNDRIRREATALAMLGDYGTALPKLIDLLDNTKNDDQPLLFVAIQVLYRMHQQDKSLSPANAARFRNYVERHQKLGGPDRAIVETWRRFVLGR